MTTFVFIDVPYAERARAAALGARWCPDARRWYCTATRYRSSAFRRWRNKSQWRRVTIHPDDTKAGLRSAKEHECLFDPATKSWYVDVTDESSLTAWHKARLTPPAVTELNVVFAERETAKKHGARWDATRRTWFVRSRAPLSAWLSARVRGPTLDPVPPCSV